MENAHQPVLTETECMMIGVFGQSPLKRLAHARAVEQAVLAKVREQAERDLAREALADLVALEDMKRHMAKIAAEPDFLDSPERLAHYDQMAVAYFRRRPHAWDNARTILGAGLRASVEPGEVIYRWQALDYSGYCYGSNPPDNLPQRCNLMAFYGAPRVHVMPDGRSFGCVLRPVVPSSEGTR